jgi:pilus assembly protein CpaF
MEMPMSFELILPFLRPIEHLILDEEISEIMVNGSGRIFIERQGEMAEVPDAHLTEKNLHVAVRNIARALGDEVNEQQPLLDSRLPDGSRVAAAIPPCSIGGTTLTIRKFRSQQFATEELVRIGSLAPELLEMLVAAIANRENILISGGTGTGKTTLLNALAHFIPVSERILVIEDTAEIQLDHCNLVRFEARREQPGIPAVTIRDLVRAALRHRPDRILLGEVRGGEAFDLLQALNTGHSGSLSTIHANSAQQTLARLTSCVLQAGIELPYTAIRSQISEAIQFVLHVERRRTCRLASELLKIHRYDPSQDRYELTTEYSCA